MWAFLSDVHGNREALERALARCRSRGAARFAFLGDLLGRGDAAGCVRLVQELATLSVQGNRDRDWSARVDAATRAYVLGLPTVATADDFACVHGDPRLFRPLDVGDLRRGAQRSYRWLRERNLRLLFFGHTHQARVWRKRGAAEPVEDVTAERVALDHGRPDTVYLVNVGTVGLPFPGKGPPACALYDGQQVQLLALGDAR